MKHLPEFRSATVLLCAAAIQFAGCAVSTGPSGDVLVGNGAVEEETRALDAFDRVEISNGITAVVQVDGDDPHAVTVAADGNLLAHVDTRIEGSTLVVEADGNIDTDNPILVTTAVPALRSATAANAVDLSVLGLREGAVEFEALNASSIRAAGTVDELGVTALNASAADTRDLEARHVAASVANASGLDVCSTDTLAGDVSTASRVDVYCEPDTVLLDADTSSSVTTH